MERQSPTWILRLARSGCASGELQTEFEEEEEQEEAPSCRDGGAEKSLPATWSRDQGLTGNQLRNSEGVCVAHGHARHAHGWKV